MLEQKLRDAERRVSLCDDASSPLLYPVSSPQPLYRQVSVMDSKDAMMDQSLATRCQDLSAENAQLREALAALMEEHPMIERMRHEVTSITASRDSLDQQVCSLPFDIYRLYTSHL